MTSTLNEFYQTRSLLSNYFSSDLDILSITYDNWTKLNDDYKAAALYVKFFDQVMMAWHRLKTPAAIEQECVSEVLMYLQKNVAKICEDNKRFTPAYIYKVCYNCIYCKSVDPYSGQTSKTSWYNNTCSNIVEVGEDTLDLFDTLTTEDTTVSSIEEDAYRDKFWGVIEEIDDADVAVVIDELLGYTKKSSKISDEKRAAVVEMLRETLDQFVM